jgi:hypothetical protein
LGLNQGFGIKIGIYIPNLKIETKYFGKTVLRKET